MTSGTCGKETHAGLTRLFIERFVIQESPYLAGLLPVVIQRDRFSDDDWYDYDFGNNILLYIFYAMRGASNIWNATTLSYLLQMINWCAKGPFVVVFITA